MRAALGVRLRHLFILSPLFILPSISPAAADKTPAPSNALDVRAFAIAANQDEPTLCFTLSQTIARRPDTPLESFVTVDPEIKLSAVPRNNRLCLAGFAFGNAYTVSLKIGLPGVSGALAKDAQFRIQVPSRPPEFDFAASGSDLLPRLANDGLPIRSVNVPKIGIAIYRIAESDLLLTRGRTKLTAEEATEFAPARGERIWRGTVEPKGDTNRDTLTTVPVQKAIGPLKPGLYVAVAQQDGVTLAPHSRVPTQYFFVSDLGVSAYRGTDSLAVWVRSLTTANAATGVDAVLVGNNNRELARARTDDNGIARFDPSALHGVGENTPAAIYFYGQSDDFAALALTDAQGGGSAAGEGVPRGTTALFYLDRDTYRPGETANALILVRNELGNAGPKPPLDIDVIRPDGAVFSTQTLTDQGSGAYALAVALPQFGSSGTWNLEAHTQTDRSVIGRVALEVGAGASPRLTASVAADAAVLDPSLATNIAVQGQYPEGQAVPNIPGELRVTIAAAANPFPAFPGFSFGLIDETAPPILVEPMRFTTDASGKAGIPLKFAVPPQTTKPLEATITARLFDVGGQPVEHIARIPVATQNLVLGVRPAPGTVFPAGQMAHFEVVAVSPDGARQEKAGIGWEILRQDSAPSWAWEDTRYAFRPMLKDTHIAGGMLDIPANAPAGLDTTLPPGRYRIEVFDPAGEAISSAHFMVGWAVPSLGDPPDAVDIKPAKLSFTGGETAEFFVKPPYEADIALATADPQIRGIAVQHVPAAGATLRLDLPQNTGVGLQLLATAVAPADAATPGLTRRAFSRLPLAADPAARRLNVTLDLPANGAPQSTLTIPVSVGGAGDEAVFVSITATDTRETDNDTTDGGSPLDRLIDQNAQSVDIVDNYGQIITASGLSNSAIGPNDAGTTAKPRAAEQSGPNDRPTTIYSGIVALDKTGKGSIPIALPDVTGRLKLRAIAWSASRTGWTEATLPVHFPLIAELALPKRLAPEDRADVTLSLDNVDGPRGEYRVTIHAEGAVAVQDAAEIVANLAEHEQRAQSIAVVAKEPGDGMVTVSVKGPNGIAFERRLPLNVRPATAPIARHLQAVLKPGGTLTADPAMTAGLRPDSMTISLTAGIGIDFDLPGIAHELMAGDYRSAEQIVGGAAPYLAPAATQKSLGLVEAKLHLEQAAQALVVYQAADGGFGRWGAGASDPWLTATITDFLTRAKTAGAAVPDAPLSQALDYLALRLAQMNGPPTDQGSVAPVALAQAAYAAKVLAANGRANLFQLRYFAERFQAEIREPVTSGLIAAAFAALGDKPAAAAGFARAMALPSDTGAADGTASDLDHLAMLTALMIESGTVAQPSIASALSKLSASAANHRQYSASEATWLLRAIGASPASEGSVKVKVGDKTLAQGSALWTGMNGPALPAIKNLGDAPVRISLTVAGLPAAGDIRDQGFEIQRWFFDTGGKPVDPAAIRQNDQMVVVLTGRFTGQGEAHPVIVDSLPAGWEIAAAEIADAANRYPWLKDLGGASRAAAEDGRFVAVPNLTGDKHEFKVAYVVRAAVRGQFALPGPFIENVTQPGQTGRGAAGRTKIDPPA